MTPSFFRGDAIEMRRSGEVCVDKERKFSCLCGQALRKVLYSAVKQTPLNVALKAMFKGVFYHRDFAAAALWRVFLRKFRKGPLLEQHDHLMSQTHVGIIAGDFLRCQPYGCG